LFPEARGQDVSLREWWTSSKLPLLERAVEARRLGDVIAVSDAARSVLELAWSAVFTSAFDSTLGRALAIPNRRLVSQIATPEFSATTSDSHLRLLRLFGTVDRETVAETPPTDIRSINTRRRIANQILNQISDVVGPRGHLVVSAWDPLNDWLRASDLAIGLAPFAEGQVTVFGVTEAQRHELTTGDFGQLVEDRIVALYAERLEDVIAALADSGEIPDSAREHERADVVTVPVIRGRAPAAAHVSPVPEELVDATFDALEWREVGIGQSPLREIELTAPLPSDAQETYQLFRELIARGPSLSNIRHIYDIAFRRPLLGQVVNTCLELAKQSAPQETLLLLRGQSGAGKSVVLCQLAVELRRRGLPVIYVPSNGARLDTSRVETFARRVASVTDAPVFLLFDGLKEEIEYRDAAEFFASRLTKCVVVGTCYTFQGDSKVSQAPRRGGARNQSRLIRSVYMDLDVRLAPAEIAELIAHINRFAPAPEKTLRELASTGVNNFFAALYSSLPEARAPLASHFLEECRKGAEFLERQIQEMAVNAHAVGQTLLELKLRAALGARLEKIRETAVPEPDDAEAAAMSRATDQMFDAAMLATHLGTTVPQSLALRLLNSNHRIYRGAFTAGLLDETEPAPGSYRISARSSVEAGIWVDRHLYHASLQMEVVRQLATHLEPAEVQDDHCDELEFLITILRAIGPQGARATRLVSQFQAIADIVSSLRKRHGGISPRLSLIEAHAVREWIKARQPDAGTMQQESTELEDFEKQLAEAEAGLRSTYSQLLEREDGKPRAGARRLLATLETERSCVLGTMLGSLVRCLPPRSYALATTQVKAEKFLRGARDAWRQSLRLHDDNFMAIDATCWILKERNDLGFSSPDERIEWMAEWSELIERYETLDLTPDQEQKRDARLDDFHHAMGNTDELARLLERVRSRGSTACDELIARRLLGEGRAEAAYLHLEEYCPPSTENTRVARLRLRTWWQWKTGFDSFFPRQRVRLGLDRNQWRRLLELIDAALRFEPESATLQFLRTVALMHLDRVVEGVEILRELDRLAVGGVRRSKLLFLVSDDAGRAVSFSAMYQGKRLGNRYVAWCDNIRQNVTFVPREHGRAEPRAGSTVGPFHLAIEFRGLYADPVGRINDV
jgi:hypothetical protein